jgi:hypothetical protein
MEPVQHLTGEQALYLVGGYLLGETGHCHHCDADQPPR